MPGLMNDLLASVSDVAAHPDVTSGKRFFVITVFGLPDSIVKGPHFGESEYRV